MKQVNLVLQGKGGVGKSFVASLLAQHYQDRGITPVCIDTDPVNGTFSGYKAFNAHRLEIMKDNDIDQRLFDQLIETIITADDDQVMVVDNGAASFVPLCSYLAETDVFGLLADQGVSIIIHTVLTGGQALNDTILSLANLFKAFPSTPICVWSNEFWGKPQTNGTPFEETKLYKNNEEHICALVRIPEVRKETFGFDLDHMLKGKLTFEEALKGSKFNIMAKQRLKMMWADLNSQMTQANL